MHRRIVDAKGKDYNWFVNNLWHTDGRRPLLERLDFLIDLREQGEEGLNTIYNDYNLVYEKEAIYTIGV